MLSRWFYQWKLRRLRKMGHYELIHLMAQLNNELAKRRSAEFRALDDTYGGTQ